MTFQPPRSEKLIFRLRPEQRAALKAIADRQDLPMSAVIRLALAEYIARERVANP